MHEKCCLVVIYAVSTENPFCRDYALLRGAKINPKILPVEEKYDVWI